MQGGFLRSENFRGGEGCRGRGFRSSTRAGRALEVFERRQLPQLVEVDALRGMVANFRHWRFCQPRAGQFEAKGCQFVPTLGKGVAFCDSPGSLILRSPFGAPFASRGGLSEQKPNAN